MYRPYTDNFPEAMAVAGQCVGVALSAVIWARPFRTRAATILFGLSVWIAALAPVAITNILRIDPNPNIVPVLQISATLATWAILLGEPRWFRAIAVLGQLALAGISLYVKESDYELTVVHLVWAGALLGIHALRGAPPRSVQPAPAFESFRRHDIAIFLVTIGAALVVTNLVFGRLIYNGDEVANSFQADVYGHLRAYAPSPPCTSMFDNYWVFRLNGRTFSQYTPGWPLFMAPFQMLGVIWLAGPVMAGICAVGLARLARRAASGLGTTAERSRRITVTAGWLGAAAMLGPSMLLNGGSRFSHTMVCACFAWAVESMCVVAGPGVSRRVGVRYGLLLGAATALGLATRPADGAVLGVGVFIYFVTVLVRRRVPLLSFIGTAIGFGFFGGLTLLILRLQLGAWFQTAYALSASIHPEATLHLSWPKPNELKYGIPISYGAYMWWPAAPALAIAGMIRMLGGRERRVAFMLFSSGITLLTFYVFVEFGRWADDGLGPRYFLPLVVVMATGGAALLAPLVEAIRFRWQVTGSRIRQGGPGVLVVLAIVYGVVRIAPMVYPIGAAEYRYSTRPFRAARNMGLKNAVVMIEPGKSTAHETNLAQNPPLQKNPDVLYLIRHSEADDACVRQNYPGRTWYRATNEERLLPF
jgi:hypothetical protein